MSSFQKYLAGGQITAVLVIAGIMITLFGINYYIQHQKEQVAIPVVSSFDFHVYCPIDPYINLEEIKKGLASKNMNIHDFNDSAWKETYVVWVQSHNISFVDGTTQAKPFYCGLARNWYDRDCKNAKLICSTPGPMFYFNVGEEANIIWINDINNTNLNWTQAECYASDSDDNICTSSAKDIKWKDNQCTYLDPTNYNYDTHHSFRVRKESVPISPHIHGLEIRPLGDGNPLSWFTNKGQVGTAYNNINLNPFFEELFSNPKAVKGLDIKASQLDGLKIVSVDNAQLSGMMFYHDHAMKSTKYNVGNGLSGLYIIRNQTAEKELPAREQERFFLFTPDGVDFAHNHSQRIHYLNGSNILNRNMTYRFRFLNAHYDSVYHDVSIVAYYDSIVKEDGTMSIVELDPTTPGFELNSDLYRHNIPFSVIGTDTSIFHSPVHGVDHFQFASAERVDMLIKFDSKGGLPQEIKKIYIICQDVPNSKYVLKFKFTLNQTKINNKYKEPEQFQQIDVAYTNLSAIPQQKVVGRRMRSLFNYPKDQTFLINGHYMFEMGASEDPQIGTTEDWYIINNLWEGHPIHVHLINFQIIDSYSLKTISEGCTLYQVDFFRKSGLPQFIGLSNGQICLYLQSLSLQEASDLYESLSNYNLQNQKRINADGTFTSGLDVMSKLNEDDGDSYSVDDCPLNNLYKYICDHTFIEVQEYQKRWKDTTNVQAFHVYVLRIRWARTDYQDSDGYPYFNIPESQLIEFPGFVYHCHILPHEDNQMMRPIMLQPSEEYKHQIINQKGYDGCERSSWKEQMQCINAKNGCI